MKIATLIAIALISFNSHAFNWTRCKAATSMPKKEKKPVDLSGKVIEKLLNGTTEPTTDATSNFTIGSMISVTSYISSTGGCKAIGMAEEKRVQYVAETHHEIQMELANGHGDYVVALGKLYGCNEKGRHHFAEIIRKNQAEIFSPNNHNDAEYTTFLMTTAVEHSELLSENCDPALAI